MEVAVVVLNQQSVAIGQQVVAALPDAKLYGFAKRVSDVDQTFDEFGDTVQTLFRQGTAVIGVCASGILIRTIAPLLGNKWQEPPLLAVAEDGSAVVPLLGGVSGANALAHQVGQILQTVPAITTAGEIRFRTSLLSPPAGYELVNPDDGKDFLAALLAGQSVRIIGQTDWLDAAKLPVDDGADLSIVVGEGGEPGPDCLVYRVVGPLNPPILGDFELSVGGVDQIPPSPPSKGGDKIKVPLLKGDLGGSQTSQQTYQLPGRLAIIGTGPGCIDWMTPEVRRVLETSTDWFGYKTYLNLVEPLRTTQNRHESDNREELDRARAALDFAATGKSVVMVSSGDPGIYAMAAAVFEAMETDAKTTWQDLNLQVCPGISAMQGAAALIGAPIGHDFCAISLSDILKPWEVIEQRIAQAAQADFVMAFYNPISSQRRWQLEKAKEKLLEYRDGTTPIVLAENVGRPGQNIRVKHLGDLQSEDANMRTMILVGSSKTRVFEQGGRQWVYTPRRYDR
ncbi:precorrin-3B C(17)-methyltransferase [filamentous cyanobacterium LEGE 11480]|uniref:Precorrin-3B C(17)-methyltransferase n=1 Tax=Romeriopsis navalis LEGE 11480 TaxID=2777977 RepID=A0A928VKW4_9CYAN|nr:precorrin-3B C(17)-methyltransferase [Romeriopsis navalis]MBE9030210.1 precorrin-3B C(17)-methyltransferase [Romeriopsis navalis LEGE 11480]